MSTSVRAGSAGETREEKRPVFVTTQWSMVLAAARADTPNARAALEGLCQTYWFPLQLDSAEERYGCEPADSHTPEQYFERRWALTLLDTEWSGSNSMETERICQSCRKPVPAEMPMGLCPECLAQG